MALDTRYINGNPVSFNSIRFSIWTPGGNGGRIFGFQNIDFGGEKRERPFIYGQSKSMGPIALAEGKYTPPNPKVTFLAHTLDADQTAPFDGLINMLARESDNGHNYGNVPMYWLLQVNAAIRAKYEWFDVYLTEPGGSWSESDDALKREVGFTCRRFKENGHTLYDSSEE